MAGRPARRRSTIMERFVDFLKWLDRDEGGQDLVEYAMLVALVAIVCVAGVTIFGEAVSAFFGSIAGQIPLP
jgi:Flp pilus assembly pilin Flp